jgi:CelD/BcsL family acetyltransferase involved in cellulose biosynthesis
MRTALSVLRADRARAEEEALVSVAPSEDLGERVRIIRTLPGLDALRPLWDSISPSWATPMQSHDWVRICAEVFGLGSDLEIFVVGEGPSAAIAPMFRSGPRGLRLEMVGANQLYEVTDFVYSDRSDMAALARALARSRFSIRLNRIPADSPIPAALVAAYRGRGIVISRESRGCPWLPLDATWVDPEQHLPKHRRQNLRRARRIAESMGPVSFEILSPTPKEVEAAVQEAYRVEASSWKGQEKSALALHPLRGEFYRRYAAAAAQRGILRLCFLRIGGEAAAMQFAAESDGRFWLLKIGYNHKFARCSPGTLLMTESIRYAAQSGLRSFEFLGVEEPWISAWTPLTHRGVSVRAYPFALRGALAVARDLIAINRSEIKALLGRRR